MVGGVHTYCGPYEVREPVRSSGFERLVDISGVRRHSHKGFGEVVLEERGLAIEYQTSPLTLRSNTRFQYVQCIGQRLNVVISSVWYDIDANRNADVTVNDSHPDDQNEIDPMRSQLCELSLGIEVATNHALRRESNS